MPEDVIINCSKGTAPKPPPGHKWKEVRHDNTVTWLASWTENVQGQVKYIMLNSASRLKGEKDWQKYEIARQLKGLLFISNVKSTNINVFSTQILLRKFEKPIKKIGNQKK